jgi:hypothetical protein
MQYTSRSHGTLLPDFDVNVSRFNKTEGQWSYFLSEPKCIGDFSTYSGFFQIHRIVANTVSEIIFSPWVFF